MNTHVQTSLSAGCHGRQAQERGRELGALYCQWWRRLDTRLSSIGSRQRGSTSIERGSCSDLAQRSQDILHAVASVVLDHVHHIMLAVPQIYVEIRTAVHIIMLICGLHNPTIRVGITTFVHNQSQSRVAFPLLHRSPEGDTWTKRRKSKSMQCTLRILPSCIHCHHKYIFYTTLCGIEYLYCHLLRCAMYAVL